MAKLFVGSLSWNTDSESMRAAFEKYGEITDSFVCMDRETRRSRGFGFVTFAVESDAEKAIDEMNGVELDGRQIKVDKASDRSGDSAGRSSGGRSGGYGGRSGGYGDRPERSEGRYGERSERSDRRYGDRSERSERSSGGRSGGYGGDRSERSERPERSERSEGGYGRSSHSSRY